MIDWTYSGSTIQWYLSHHVVIAVFVVSSRIYELASKVTLPRITILVVNLGVVSYLLFVLVKERDKKTS